MSSLERIEGIGWGCFGLLCMVLGKMTDVSLLVVGGFVSFGFGIYCHCKDIYDGLKEKNGCK